MSEKLKVAVMVTATAKYREFVNQLYREVKRLFLPQHEVTFVLFSNDLNGLSFDQGFFCEHRPWPWVTIRKFNRFVEQRHYFEKFDYCYMLDADCKIESEVGEEILGELTAVVHPGFCGGVGTPCVDPRSRSCMQGMLMRTPYLAGAVVGGRTDAWLELCDELKRRVDADNEDGVIATWHDESHLLKYLNEEPNWRRVRILGWEYCFAYGLSRPTGRRVVISHRTKGPGFK